MGKYFHDDDVGEAWKYDASFVGVVPGAQRKFRDVGCGIVFFICLSIMLCITAVTYLHSDTDVLLNHSGTWDDDLKNFRTNRDVIVVGVACTVVLGYIWLEFLKYCTKPLVYGSLALAVVGMVAAGALMLTNDLKGSHICGIVLIVSGALLAAVSCCMRNRIAFSCELIGHAAKGVQANKALFMILTPFFFAVTAGFLIWWAETMWFVNSQSRNVDCPRILDERLLCESLACTWDPDNATRHCSGSGREIDTAMRWAMIYLVFMLFWGSYFLAGCAKVAISGTIAQWYFARDKRDLGFFGFWGMLKWTLTYHVGSIAKGSALLAALKLAEMALEAAERDAENGFVKFFLCIIRCLFSCVAGIIRWITKYAYIYVAMHGQPFVESSRQVRKLFLRSHYGALFTTDFVVNLIVHMGMFACVGFVCLGSVAYMRSHDEANYSVSAIVVIAVFSSVTFWTIGQVVETAANAVVVCFMEDAERHSGSRDFRGEDTYFAVQQSAQTYQRSGERGGAAYGTVM